MNEETGLQPEVTETPAEPVEKPVVEAPADKAAEKPEPVSRRDAVAAAMKKHEDRARDPASGRFVEQKAKPVAPAAPVAPVQRKDMPRSWKQDYRAKWDALDPELANFVAETEAKREQDVLRGIEQYKDGAARWNDLRSVLQPHEQMLTQYYGSVAGGIKHLFDLSSFASQDPSGFIRWLAQQRGIDLSSLQAQAADPQQQSLQAALQPWQQKVSALEQRLQQFTTSQQQQAEAQSLRAVEAFLGEQDNGQPKHPLGEGLESEFAKFVRFVRSDNPDLDDRAVLEKAYETLVWAHPQMREQHLARQEAERKAKLERELAAKRAAAVSVKGAPSTSAPASPDPRNRRALIERALADSQR